MDMNEIMHSIQVLAIIVLLYTIFLFLFPHGVNLKNHRCVINLFFYTATEK